MPDASSSASPKSSGERNLAFYGQKYAPNAKDSDLQLPFLRKVKAFTPKEKDDISGIHEQASPLTVCNSSLRCFDQFIMRESTFEKVRQKKKADKDMKPLNLKWNILDCCSTQLIQYYQPNVSDPSPTKAQYPCHEFMKEANKLYRFENETTHLLQGSLPQLGNLLLNYDTIQGLLQKICQTEFSTELSGLPSWSDTFAQPTVSAEMKRKGEIDAVKQLGALRCDFAALLYEFSELLQENTSRCPGFSLLRRCLLLFDFLLNLHRSLNHQTERISLETVCLSCTTPLGLNPVLCSLCKERLGHLSFLIIPLIQNHSCDGAESAASLLFIAGLYQYGVNILTQRFFQNLMKNMAFSRFHIKKNDLPVSLSNGKEAIFSNLDPLTYALLFSSSVCELKERLVRHGNFLKSNENENEDKDGPRCSFSYSCSDQQESGHSFVTCAASCVSEHPKSKDVNVYPSLVPLSSAIHGVLHLINLISEAGRHTVLRSDQMDRLITSLGSIVGYILEVALKTQNKIYALLRTLAYVILQNLVKHLASRIAWIQHISVRPKHTDSCPDLPPPSFNFFATIQETIKTFLEDLNFRKGVRSDEFALAKNGYHTNSSSKQVTEKQQSSNGASLTTSSRHSPLDQHSNSKPYRRASVVNLPFDEASNDIDVSRHFLMPPRGESRPVSPFLTLGEHWVPAPKDLIENILEKNSASLLKTWRIHLETLINSNCVVKFKIVRHAWGLQRKVVCEKRSSALQPAVFMWNPSRIPCLLYYFPNDKQEVNFSSLEDVTCVRVLDNRVTLKIDFSLIDSTLLKILQAHEPTDTLGTLRVSQAPPSDDHPLLFSSLNRIKEVSNTCEPFDSHFLKESPTALNVTYGLCDIYQIVDDIKSIFNQRHTKDPGDLAANIRRIINKRSNEVVYDRMGCREFLLNANFDLCLSERLIRKNQNNGYVECSIYTDYFSNEINQSQRPCTLQCAAQSLLKYLQETPRRMENVLEDSFMVENICSSYHSTFPFSNLKNVSSESPKIMKRADVKNIQTLEQDFLDDQYLNSNKQESSSVVDHNKKMSQDERLTLHINNKRCSSSELSDVVLSHNSTFSVNPVGPQSVFQSPVPSLMLRKYIIRSPDVSLLPAEQTPLHSVNPGLQTMSCSLNYVNLSDADNAMSHSKTGILPEESLCKISETAQTSSCSTTQSFPFTTYDSRESENLACFRSNFWNWDLNINEALISYKNVKPLTPAMNEQGVLFHRLLNYQGTKSSSASCVRVLLWRRALILRKTKLFTNTLTYGRPLFRRWKRALEASDRVRRFEGDLFAWGVLPVRALHHPDMWVPLPKGYCEAQAAALRSLYQKDRRSSYNLPQTAPGMIHSSSTTFTNVPQDILQENETSKKAYRTVRRRKRNNCFRTVATSFPERAQSSPVSYNPDFVLFNSLIWCHSSYSVLDLIYQKRLLTNLLSILSWEDTVSFLKCPFPLIQGALAVKLHFAEESRSLVSNLLVQNNETSLNRLAKSQTRLMSAHTRQRITRERSLRPQRTIEIRENGLRGAPGLLGSAEKNCIFETSRLDYDQMSDMGVSHSNDSYRVPYSQSNQSASKHIYDNSIGSSSHHKHSVLQRLGCAKDFYYFQPCQMIYVDTCHEIRDIEAYEIEREQFIFWSYSEIEMFLNRFFLTPKNFGRIAQSMTAAFVVKNLCPTYLAEPFVFPVITGDCRMKTVAHCVDFYYRLKYFFELKRLIEELQIGVTSTKNFSTYRVSRKNPAKEQVVKQLMLKFSRTYQELREFNLQLRKFGLFDFFSEKLQNGTKAVNTSWSHDEVIFNECKLKSRNYIDCAQKDDTTFWNSLSHFGANLSIHIMKPNQHFDITSPIYQRAYQKLQQNRHLFNTLVLPFIATEFQMLLNQPQSIPLVYSLKTLSSISAWSSLKNFIFEEGPPRKGSNLCSSTSLTHSVSLDTPYEGYILPQSITGLFPSQTFFTLPSDIRGVGHSIRTQDLIILKPVESNLPWNPLTCNTPPGKHKTEVSSLQKPFDNFSCMAKGLAEQALPHSGALPFNTDSTQDSLFKEASQTSPKEEDQEQKNINQGKDYIRSPDIKRPIPLSILKNSSLDSCVLNQFNSHIWLYRIQNFLRKFKINNEIGVVEKQDEPLGHASTKPTASKTYKENNTKAAILEAFTQNNPVQVKCTVKLLDETLKWFELYKTDPSETLTYHTTGQVKPDTERHKRTSFSEDAKTVCNTHRPFFSSMQTKRVKAIEEKLSTVARTIDDINFSTLLSNDECPDYLNDSSLGLNEKQTSLTPKDCLAYASSYPAKSCYPEKQSSHVRTTSHINGDAIEKPQDCTFPLSSPLNETTPLDEASLKNTQINQKKYCFIQPQSSRLCAREQTSLSVALEETDQAFLDKENKAALNSRYSYSCPTLNSNEDIIKQQTNETISVTETRHKAQQIFQTKASKLSTCTEQAESVPRSDKIIQHESLNKQSPELYHQSQRETITDALISNEKMLLSPKKYFNNTTDQMLLQKNINNLLTEPLWYYPSLISLLSAAYNVSWPIPSQWLSADEILNWNFYEAYASVLARMSSSQPLVFFNHTNTASYSCEQKEQTSPLNAIFAAAVAVANQQQKSRSSTNTRMRLSKKNTSSASVSNMPLTSDEKYPVLPSSTGNQLKVRAILPPDSSSLLNTSTNPISSSSINQHNLINDADIRSPAPYANLTPEQSHQTLLPEEHTPERSCSVDCDNLTSSLCLSKRQRVIYEKQIIPQQTTTIDLSLIDECTTAKEINNIIESSNISTAAQHLSNNLISSLPTDAKCSQSLSDSNQETEF